MEKTFKEFMARRYAEAEEFACGVTREQEDIAHEAWELATNAEREACAVVAESVTPRHTECGRKIAHAIRMRSNA